MAALTLGGDCVTRGLRSAQPLTGEDGNAFAILGRTTRALRQAGLPNEEIDAFFAEATSGDYDHLLQTTMAWVEWQ